MNFNRAKFKSKPKSEEGESKSHQHKKIIQDGITFDSKLEYYMYTLLLENNVAFEFRKQFCLQPQVRYMGDLVHAITLTVDFYLPNEDIILDPKGLQHGDNHLKWKMLKYHLVANNQSPRICFVYSQKAAREFIEQLKHGFTEDIEPKFVNGRITRLKKLFKLIDGWFILPTGERVLEASKLSTMPNYDLYKVLEKYQS